PGNPIWFGTKSASIYPRRGLWEGEAPAEPRDPAGSAGASPSRDLPRPGSIEPPWKKLVLRDGGFLSHRAEADLELDQVFEQPGIIDGMSLAEQAAEDRS